VLLMQQLLQQWQLLGQRMKMQEMLLNGSRMLCSGSHAASPRAAAPSADDSSSSTTASAGDFFVAASPAGVSWVLSHDLAAAELQLTQLAAASCHPAILPTSGTDNRQAVETAADGKATPAAGIRDATGGKSCKDEAATSNGTCRNQQAASTAGAGPAGEAGVTSDSSTGSQLLADAIATQQMQAAGAIAVRQAHQRVVAIYRARAELLQAAKAAKGPPAPPAAPPL